MESTQEIVQLLNEVKVLARKYKNLTGKPLGVTAEIAEVAASTVLGLDLCQARQPGFDAIRTDGDRRIRIQIKGRCVTDPPKSGARVGQIKLNKEWDKVILVLLNENFDLLKIYEAERSKIEEALKAPGSRARNERGALSISKFKSIGRLVWPKE